GMTPVFALSSFGGPLFLLNIHMSDVADLPHQLFTESMESVSIIGHKRSRSAADSESGLQETTPAARKTARDAPRVLLVHLSALLSCNEAVVRVKPAILADILPASDIPSFTDQAVLRVFSKS